MNELSALLPEPRLIPVGGRELKIYPLRVRQLSQFARAMAPLMDAYASVREAGGLEALSVEDWRGLLGDHADAVVEAVAAAAEISPEWVGDLFPDDLLRLALAVLEVNADFFARRLMPQILARPTAPAGPTPATGSSAPDTGT